MTRGGRLLWSLAASAFLLVLTAGCAAGPSDAGIATAEAACLHLLGLINGERAAEGLPALALGGNPAAQEHAEEELRLGYTSHWDSAGRKPYMRHAAGGGAGYSAENAFGPIGPVDPQSFPARPLKDLLEQAHRELMSSSAHRANILDPWHQEVSLGIAWNEAAVWIVQDFARAGPAFTEAPAITGEVLSFSGRFPEGTRLGAVQVWYDPPPLPLTLGQLGETSCYDQGLPAAQLRPPPFPGTQATVFTTSVVFSRCPDPHAVDPATPPKAATGVFAPAPPVSQSAEVPLVGARVWLPGTAFRVEANLGEVLRRHGPGVYTVRIWGYDGRRNVEAAAAVIHVRPSAP